MRRLMIDTDTASDDSAAIMIAALSPGIEILSVTITAGDGNHPGPLLLPLLCTYGQVIFYREDRTYEAMPEIGDYHVSVITQVDEELFTRRFLRLLTGAE